MNEKGLFNENKDNLSSQLQAASQPVGQQLVSCQSASKTQNKGMWKSQIIKENIINNTVLGTRNGYLANYSDQHSVNSV